MVNLVWSFTARRMWCSLDLNWPWIDAWLGRIVPAALEAVFQIVPSWTFITEGGNESWSNWKCIAPGWRTAGSMTHCVSKTFFMTFNILSILPPAASKAQLESFFWYQVGWLLLIAFSSLAQLKRPTSLFQRIWASHSFYNIKKGKWQACWNATCSRKPE